MRISATTSIEAARGQIPKRQLLFVLGMHRSGTSAVSRLLNLLGCAMPFHLLGQGTWNPVGHWEPYDLSIIHDRFLHSVGSAWDDPRPLPAGAMSSSEASATQVRIERFLQGGLPADGLVVVKDPRLCRLLPLWSGPLKRWEIEPLAIIVRRSPWDVAASLARRDGISTAKSIILWLRHLLAAERFSRGWRRASIAYDAMLADWRVEARRLFASLDLACPGIGPGHIRAVEEFLSMHRRHHFKNLVENIPCAELANRCYALLETLDEPAKANSEPFDALQRYMDAHDEGEPTALDRSDRRRKPVEFVAVDGRPDGNEGRSGTPTSLGNSMPEAYEEIGQPAITPQSVAVINENIIVTTMDGQVLLVDCDKFHAADMIGSKIVEMLDGERNVMQIIDELSARHDVDPSVCKHDVVKFLQVLLDQKLISLR